MMAQARVRGAVMLLLINLVIGFSLPCIDWRAHVGGLIAGLAAGFAVDPGRPPAPPPRVHGSRAARAPLGLGRARRVPQRAIQADPSVLSGGG